MSTLFLRRGAGGGGCCCRAARRSLPSKSLTRNHLSRVGGGFGRHGGFAAGGPLAVQGQPWLRALSVCDCSSQPRRGRPLTDAVRPLGRPWRAAVQRCADAARGRARAVEASPECSFLDRTYTVRGSYNPPPPRGSPRVPGGSPPLLIEVAKSPVSNPHVDVDGAETAILRAPEQWGEIRSGRGNAKWKK